MKNAKVWITVVVALAATLLVYRIVSHNRTTGDQTQARQNQPIRIGTNRALGTVTPYIAKDKGLFQQQNLQVDIVDFNDITTLMEAFASGQLDVALVGISSPAIWQERGVKLKVVAAANGGGHVLLTRSDTGINDLRGLKGKKVATPKPATVTDTLFRTYIAKQLAGLDPDKDLQMVPDMAAADMPTVLFVSREVDAAITWEPFASQAEAKYPNAKVLYDAAPEWRKAHPGSTNFYPVNVVIARQQFIDQRPADLRKLLQAYTQTIQFINDNQDEANGLISHEIQLDKSVVASARKRIDYTWKIDTEASLQTLQWAHSLGYLKQIPAADKLFDPSFLPRQ
jgi:NitT/TauT family transport system substrate-binding protein